MLSVNCFVKKTNSKMQFIKGRMLGVIEKTEQDTMFVVSVKINKYDLTGLKREIKPCLLGDTVWL